MDYFGNLEYSYATMAKDVRAVIEQDVGRVSSTHLLGNISDTASLATGIPSINTELGTWDLSRKIQKYKPGYYLALGDERKIFHALRQHFWVEYLAEWNVFGNYDDGKKVYLYRLKDQSD
jgi:hypothetical protein